MTIAQLPPAPSLPQTPDARVNPAPADEPFDRTFDDAVAREADRTRADRRKRTSEPGGDPATSAAKPGPEATQESNNTHTDNSDSAVDVHTDQTGEVDPDSSTAVDDSAAEVVEGDEPQPDREHPFAESQSSAHAQPQLSVTESPESGLVQPSSAVESPLAAASVKADTAADAGANQTAAPSGELPVALSNQNIDRADSSPLISATTVVATDQQPGQVGVRASATPAEVRADAPPIIGVNAEALAGQESANQGAANGDGQGHSSSGEQQNQQHTARTPQSVVTDGESAVRVAAASAVAQILPTTDVSTGEAALLQAADSVSGGPATPSTQSSTPALGTLAATPPAGDSLEADANVSRVVRGVYGVIKQNGGTMTIRMDPPDLGTVRIHVQIKGGIVNAHFGTSHDAVRALLNQQMGQLRHALEVQGLTVDRLQVQTTSQDSAAFDFDRQSDRSEGDGRSRGRFSQQGGSTDEPTADGTASPDDAVGFERELNLVG